MFLWFKRNATWIFSGVGVAIILVITNVFFEVRDVVIVNEPPKKENSILEITKILFTDDSEFDVMVRNIGDSDLIIHKITITKLEELPLEVKPLLKPTARYYLPVDEIPVGGSKTIDVSHVVHRNRADRFLIALDTTCIYLLKVTFEYNRGKMASFEKGTWIEKDSPRWRAMERWYN
jgi:hypothetical protein